MIMKFKRQNFKTYSQRFINVLLFLSIATCARAENTNDPARVRLALNLGAKLLCSQVFIAGRDEHEALYNSVWPFVNSTYLHPEQSVLDYSQVDIHVDRLAGHVTFRHKQLDLQGRAGYYADQGCIIHANAEQDIYFKPVKLTSSLPPANELAWPMGDLITQADLSPELDRGELERAVSLVFSPGNYTAAFLVVHKGQIVAERYGPGISKDTLLEGWSTGKSLVATLLGVAANAEADFDLFAPAGFEEWQGKQDARQQIRIADILRMSSGLKYSYYSDDPVNWDQAVSDHLFGYVSGVNVFEFAVNRPAEFPPNTVGRYRNSDPLLIGYLVKNMLQARNEDYLTFPQRALFDKIGIRRFIIETDPYGNFVNSGYEYSSARNWARLGMLYLQNGVWNGERLLPEGFVDFIRTPAPAWDEAIYGGMFWLNPGHLWEGLPADNYAMVGGGGQFVIIIPSRDMVIVRLGHMIGFNFRRQEAKKNLEQAFQHLLRAIPES